MQIQDIFNMDYEFETELMKLTKKWRVVFDDAKELFLEKRNSLNINYFYDTDNYESIEVRRHGEKALEQFNAQLKLQKQFLEEFNKNCIGQVSKIAYLIPAESRDNYLRDISAILDRNAANRIIEMDKWIELNEKHLQYIRLNRAHDLYFSLNAGINYLLKKNVLNQTVY